MTIRIAKILFIFWPLLIGTLLGFSIIYLRNHDSLLHHSFLSPLGLDSQTLAAKVPSKKPLIGFLPYWTVKDADIPYHLLDHLAYFSVSLEADGTPTKRVNNENDMGWYYLHSKTMETIFKTAKQNDVKTVIVITAFKNNLIDTLITDDNAKKQAINTISSLVRDFEFDGVNIDFEYDLSKQVKPENAKNYVRFLEELKQELQTINPSIILSVDLYANAFIHDKPYDAVGLGKVADQLILMGYDFYQKASTRAGPVAPLKSQSGRSISESLQSALDKGISSEKIVLAMPFYGYEWQTTTEEYGAPTYPGTGTTALYKRVHTLIKEESLTPQWDHQAMSPWIVYTKNDKTRQIYFENDQSIALKLQLIDQVTLGGGAIWALGYEGENASVWQVIEDWRKKQQ